MIMEIKMNNSLTFDEVADKLGCSVEDLQKMKEQNNRLERIYGKHLKLIVCTGKRSEKVKFKHED